MDNKLEENKTRHHLQSALLVILLVIASKGLGFVRDLILAFFYGTNAVVDQVYTASNIVSIFYGWLASVAVVFTPIYMDHKREENQSEIKLLNTWLTISYIVGIACVIINYFASGVLVRITVPGFDEIATIQTRAFAVIIGFSVIATTPAKLYKAYLSCEKKYISTAVPVLAINVVQITFIIISAFTNSRFIAIGYACSSFAELLACIALSGKKKYRWHPMIVKSSDNLLVIRTAIPVFINTALLDICSYVNKIFASTLSVGTISSLSYATSINRIVIDSITIIITTFYYPILSDKVSKGQNETVIKTLNKCIDFCLIVLVPLSIGVACLSEPIVTLIFERGAFNSTSTIMTSSALKAFAIGVPALALRSLFVYLFYSLKKTKTCTLISVAYLFIYVLFSYILVQLFQHVGLAASTGLAAYVTLPIYILAYARHFKQIFIKHTLTVASKCLISGLLMGVTVYLAYHGILLLHLSSMFTSVLSLVLGVAVGAITYSLGLRLLKVEQHKEYLHMFKSIFQKRGYSPSQD